MVTHRKLTTITVYPAAVTGQRANPLTNVPPIDSSDLVSYLVFQTSLATAKYFKAHKSIKGFNQIPLQLGERCESLECEQQMLCYWKVSA